MPVHCPKYGTLLYGRRCTDCTCENYHERDVERSDPTRPPRQIGRQFVIVPRDESQKPDVPLRVPTHYCLDCGAREVACFECDIVSYPLENAWRGYHISRCPKHGALSVICPNRGLRDVPESIAGNSDQAERPQLTYHDKPQEPRQDMQLLYRTLKACQEENLRLRDRMGRAIAIGLLLGFSVGAALGATLPLMARYMHERQAQQEQIER